MESKRYTILVYRFRYHNTDMLQPFQKNGQEEYEIFKKIFLSTKIAFIHGLYGYVYAFGTIPSTAIPGIGLPEFPDQSIAVVHRARLKPLLTRMD